MSGWPTAPMRDLFRIVKGQIGIKAATPGEFPLVTTGESHLSHIEAHFSGEAICIPMVSASGHGHASIKRLHYIQGNFAVGSILCACINQKPERVLTRYVFYYLTACKDNVLIPLMQGSANVSLKLADIQGIEIPLPTFSEQQAIVSHLDTLAEKSRLINEHLDAIETDAERLLAVQFRDAINSAPLRIMAAIAPLVRREEQICLEENYLELGIRSFGKGTFHKPALTGAEVGTKRLFRIEPGDLLFSNVFAWEGAIAIAQLNDAGRFGSHRFISCIADKNITSVEFLRYYFLSEAGMAKINDASPGGAGRNRTLGLEKLMAIEVPLPTLEVQQTFDTLQAKVAELKAKHAVIRKANQALLPSTLERVFSEPA